MVRPKKISDEAILEVARRCFLERGPRTSTNWIADEVGLSQAALFKRFGTKKKLMFAALAPRPERWLRELSPPHRGDDFALKLIELGLKLLDFFRQSVPAIAVLRMSCTSPAEVLSSFDTPPPVIAVRGLQRWFTRAHQEGLIRHTDFEAVAMNFLGAIHFRAFLTHIGQEALGGADDSDYIAHIVDGLFFGLKTREER